MLKPIFNVCLSNGGEADGEIVIEKPAPPDFKITYYASVGPYTLVGWVDGENENGEYLYRGDTPIAIANGSLRLYEAPSRFPPASVWDRIDSNTGQYGVPAHIAIALRSPENTYLL